MKYVLQIFIPLGSLLVLWSCNRPQDEGPNIDIAAPVSVAEVQYGSIQNYATTTGTAIAEEVTELTSQIPGKYHLQNHPVHKRPFKIGDRVKAGQLFVEIEDKEYVNGIGLEAVELNLELTEQEYEKQKSIFEKGGVTLRELRNSELQLTRAKNDLESAQIKLEKMKIFIPISGVIVKLPQYTQGSRIEAGKPLATIMDYARMYVEVNLPENTITTIKTGQKALITNYSLPNDTLSGTVNELSPAIDVETRTYLGKIRFNNPRLLVRPGMFIKVGIKTAQKSDVLTIPKEVIISDQQGKRVFVVEENTAFERIVETGLESEDLVEIVSGLEENERLVVKGFETLRNKSKVKVLR